MPFDRYKTLALCQSKVDKKIGITNNPQYHLFHLSSLNHLLYSSHKIETEVALWFFYSCHDLFAFCTFCGKLLLKAAHTIHISIIGNDERFATNLLFTNHALKTLVVPFTRFVLHFLHTWWKFNPLRNLGKIQSFSSHIVDFATLCYCVEQHLQMTHCQINNFWLF